MVGVVLTRANEAVITISSHPNNMRTTFKFIAAFQSFFFLPFFLSFPFRNETHTRHLQRYFFGKKKKNSPWDSVALIATSWRNNFSRQTRNRRPKYKFSFKKETRTHTQPCLCAWKMWRGIKISFPRCLVCCFVGSNRYNISLQMEKYSEINHRIFLSRYPRIPPVWQ